MKTKHQRLMSVARSLARVSEAGDLKVGAVIVAAGRIIGSGWNDETVDPPIHAEINAINMAYYTGTTPSTMYVTTSPCLACAKAIIGDGGIAALYYQFEWWDKAALELLQASNIIVEQVRRETR